MPGNGLANADCTFEPRSVCTLLGCCRMICSAGPLVGMTSGHVKCASVSCFKGTLLFGTCSGDLWRGPWPNSWGQRATSRCVVRILPQLCWIDGIGAYELGVSSGHVGRLPNCCWTALPFVLRVGVTPTLAGSVRLRTTPCSAERGRLRLISISANFDFGQFLDVGFLDHKGFPEGWGRRVGPRRVGAQNLALFFPLPLPGSVCLFGCLLVEFWCLKRPGPQMCPFGLSDCLAGKGFWGQKRKQNKEK